MCSVCNRKKSRFIEEKYAIRLLSKLTTIKKSILSGLPIAKILFVLVSACGPFTKKKEKIKQFKKQEIQHIFIKMNQIKLVFNMLWLMELFKI